MQLPRRRRGGAARLGRAARRVRTARAALRGRTARRRTGGLNLWRRTGGPSGRWRLGLPESPTAGGCSRSRGRSGRRRSCWLPDGRRFSLVLCTARRRTHPHHLQDRINLLLRARTGVRAPVFDRQFYTFDLMRSVRRLSTSGTSARRLSFAPSPPRTRALGTRLRARPRCEDDESLRGCSHDT